MSGFWAGKSVLVTGASGVVGSWLVPLLLDEGAHVAVLLRDDDHRSHFYRSRAAEHVAVVNGALEDFRTVERAINEHATDTVVHLGAQTIVDTALRAPLPTFEANIRGTYNVLEACRQHRNLVERVAVASSDKAYGDHGGQAYQEDAPLAAKHPYDVSKACGDLLAQTYAWTYELPVVIARCGNIYGGGDLNWSRIVPGTIRSLLEGQPPVLRSDGSFVRDYLYVKDAASAYLTIAEHAADEPVRGEAFNFSPGSPVTVLAMVAKLRQIAGREDLQPVILNTARNEIRTQVLQSEKARTRFGWAPRYSLDEGLAETWTWYRDFLSDTWRKSS
ncbi:MAG: GDP-mannose 4,6-dehydratase [Chloroflexi bacterium]|nr:GDP-mannose 4,6-dehydratase [Chloroflexota bacterium]